jgi:hypothetical protein
MPFFNKSFDYATDLNENFVETENYLTRLAKARRNYLPS